ncbi:MAG TPA: hypothetical protein VGK67_24360 [Myxococcales bacterium]
MRTMTLAWAAIAALGLIGCSNEFESAEMKVRYHPPRGVKFVDEVPGPPRVAHFSSGLEIRSVDTPPPAYQEDKLEDLLKVVSPEASGAIISARPGSLDAGKVVRWTLKEEGRRTIVYFVPRTTRYLVISMSASEGRYSDAENQLELSLSSLRVKD